MSELAFFTTSELIDELMRRSTFLGVVVHWEEELKLNRWSGDRHFRVHFNKNLNAPQASRLLGAVSEYIGDISS